MINVYYQQGKELGFTFHQFSSGRYVNDFRVFDSEPQARAYLDGSKYQLVMLNLEHFIRLFKKDTDTMSTLEKESFDRLELGLIWAVKASASSKEVWRTLIKCEKFMITLVNSASGDQRAEAIMQSRILINYLRSELADDKGVSHKGSKAS